VAVAVAVAAEAEPAIPVAAEAPRIFAASVADMFRAPALELRELATRMSVPRVFTDPRPGQGRRE
jgi:hypothetical protein